MERLEQSFAQELTNRQINELRARARQAFEEVPEPKRWDALIYASWVIRQRQWYRSLFLIHACLCAVLVMALGVAIIL